jgi:hypothetical protein
MGTSEIEPESEFCYVCVFLQRNHQALVCSIIEIMTDQRKTTWEGEVCQ